MDNIDLETLGYTTMLVQYDDQGQVHFISNAYNNEYKNFQINLSLIEEFLSGGKKNPKKYLSHEKKKIWEITAIKIVISNKL